MRDGGTKGDRVKRRMFDILAATSLLLCLATCALWVRGCWIRDGWRTVRFIGPHTRVESRLELGLLHGIRFTRERESLGSNVYFQINRDDRRAMGRPEYVGCTWVEIAYAPLLRARPDFFLGFSFRHDRERFLDGNMGLDVLHVGVPYWFLSAAFIVLPVWWLRRGRRGHGVGFCKSCGYDLRATPGRCPECGLTARSAT